MILGWYKRWQLRRRVTTRRPGKISGSGRLRRWATSLVGLPGRIFWTLAGPLLVLVDYSGRSKRRVRDLLYGLPAVIVAVSLIGATLYSNRLSTETELAYWRRIGRVWQTNDLDTGKLVVQRALNSRVVNRNEAAFALARIYMLAGVDERASNVLNDLAPVNKVGYPPAHRLQAIAASERFRASGDVQEIEKLRWHIEHGDGEQSVDMYRARGLYHAAMGEVDKAVELLMKAVEQRPDVYFELAELLVQHGRRSEAFQMVTRAEKVYQAKFERDPQDDESRLRLATAFFAQGKLPDAERLVRDRLALGDDKKFFQLLSMIFVRFYDHQVESGEPLGDALPALQKAIDADANNREALRRLQNLAGRHAESRDEIREVLLGTIADGSASAMSHFVLGIVEWLQDNRDDAQFHLEQALLLQPSWGVVANNLAYLLATDENADLERAEELADIAIMGDPTNGEYRDTRGLIRQRRGNLKGAAVDFQKALEGSSDPATQRSRLAAIYHQMGRKDIAEAYERGISDPQVGESGSDPR